MNILKAALYDPSVAVSKATSSLLAMTALDTSNLRLAITVPAHGMVRFKMRGTIVGATTTPTVLLGVMNGATVIGRAMPQYENATANVATQGFTMDAEFTVSGLTPGAMNVDAAYAVQVIVASTNIKYGGPNTNAGANAWGGFLFEAWDPQPISPAQQLLVDANGRVDVIKVAGTTQTARDLGAQLDATVSSRMATYTQPTGFLAATFPTGTIANTTNITAGTITTATNLTNAPTAGDFTATMKTSLNAATPASVTGAVGSVTGNVGGNVVGSVGSVTAAVSLTGDFSATMKTSIGTAVAASAVASVTGNVGGNVVGSVASVTAAVSVTGDLSATMKTSVTTACTASTPTAAAVTGAVGSVTGNVGGNVTGSVGSVVGAVGSVTGAVSVTGDLSATMKASVTAAVPSAAAIRAEMDSNSLGLSAIFARTDVATSSRLASASYTAPDNTRPANFTALAITAGGAVTAGTVSDKTGYALSSSAVAAVWDELIEAGHSGRELHRLFAAALLGKATGLDTGLPVFRDLGDTKARISATTDASGNRSAVTLDGT